MSPSLDSSLPIVLLIQATSSFSWFFLCFSCLPFPLRFDLHVPGSDLRYLSLKLTDRYLLDDDHVPKTTLGCDLGDCPIGFA